MRCCGYFINYLQPVFVESMVQFVNIQIFFWKKEFKCTYCKAIFIIFFFNILEVFYAFLFRPLVKGKKLFFADELFVIAYKWSQKFAKIQNLPIKKRCLDKF